MIYKPRIKKNQNTQFVPSPNEEITRPLDRFTDHVLHNLADEVQEIHKNLPIQQQNSNTLAAIQSLLQGKLELYDTMFFTSVTNEYNKKYQYNIGYIISSKLDKEKTSLEQSTSPNETDVNNTLGQIVLGKVLRRL